MRYVRVFAEPTDDGPDWEFSPICVDAIIDDDGNILGHHALFGFSGDINRRDVDFQPFLLDHSGRIDWGDGFDDVPNARYGNCDLRDDPLTQGRLLTTTSIDGTARFRITRIIDLPATR